MLKISRSTLLGWKDLHAEEISKNSNSTKRNGVVEELCIARTDKSSRFQAVQAKFKLDGCSRSIGDENQGEEGLSTEGMEGFHRARGCPPHSVLEPLAICAEAAGTQM
jgi:hypothetical protein